MPKNDSVDMNTFEQIVGLERWAAVEMRFQGRKHQGEQGDDGIISN
jgi:hypothetical protein